MEWNPISEINENLDGESVLVWQHNLSDPTCLGRFQRAVCYKGSHIDVYPLTHRTTFDLKDGFYEGYDLEGDLCRVTHFSIASPPKQVTIQPNPMGGITNALINELVAPPKQKDNE